MASDVFALGNSPRQPEQGSEPGADVSPDAGAPLAVSHEEMAQYSQIVQRLADNFTTFDGDGDFRINRDELKIVTRDEAATSDQKQLAQLMLAHFDEAAGIAGIQHKPMTSVAGYAFDQMFGDYYGGNVISRSDLEAMQLLSSPAELESKLQRVRADEVAWGVGEVLGGAVTTAFGAVTTVGMGLLVPESGGLSLFGVAAYGAVTVGGVAVVMEGVNNLSNSGEDALRQEAADRQRILASWS